MCGCGCEFGLVLAACRAAEAERPRAQRTPASPRQGVFQGLLRICERMALAWLAGLLGENELGRGS